MLYEYLQSFTNHVCAVRGILSHAAVHPLHNPGEVDLSADVDFGMLRQVAHEASPGLCCPALMWQRDFLAAMGLEPRVNAILRKLTDKASRRRIADSAARLVASPGMGSAYKVFAIAHEDVGKDGVPGFH